MSIPALVQRFYDEIWNAGNLSAATSIVADDFSFRGSLGAEVRGREPFLDYVRAVQNSLADYKCEILECVSEGNQAFAKMRFSGVHRAEFRGFKATGKPVAWMGAALFRFEGQTIAELWVLGDLASLDKVLAAASTFGVDAQIR